MRTVEKEQVEIKRKRKRKEETWSKNYTHTLTQSTCMSKGKALSEYPRRRRSIGADLALKETELKSLRNLGDIIRLATFLCCFHLSPLALKMP